MEHMCARCARIFLQNPRRPLSRSTRSTLRPFSSVTSKWARGRLDTSQHPKDQGQPSSQTKAKDAAAPGRARAAGRRTAADPNRFADISSDQRPSRSRNSAAASAALGKPVANSTFNQPATQGPTGQLQNHPEVKDAEIFTQLSKMKKDTGPSLKEKMTFIRQFRESGEIGDDITDEQALAAFAEADQEAHQEEDDAQEEQENAVEENIADEQTAALLEKMSDKGVDSLTQAELATVAKFLGLIDEDGDIVKPSQLARINPLEGMTDDDLEILPPGQRSALIHQLTVGHEHEIGQFLKLQDAEIHKLSEQEKADILHELGVIDRKGNVQDLQKVFQERYDPDSFDNVYRQKVLFEQLIGKSDELSDEDKMKIVGALDLEVAEDGEIKDIYERYEALDVDAANARLEAEVAQQNADLLATQSEEDDDTPISIEEPEEESPITETSIETQPFGPKPEVSEEELALLEQLSDENIDNLTQDQIQELANRLDLVNDDGTIRDPGSYPYSRVDWPEEQAMRAQIMKELADATDEDGNQIELTPEEEEDKYVEEVIAPSPIATHALPYTPHEHTTTELRDDWPNTPLSNTGLAESVMQKVTYLAQRLPHGYWTPSQIAERYEEGYLVRFESEQEKETVLKLAAELANARAEKAAQKSGESTTAQGMAFRSLGEGERGKEASGLMDKMVKGTYVEVEKKQSRAFLDGVVRQLANNESYAGEDTEKFVGRVEELIRKISKSGGVSQEKADGEGKEKEKQKEVEKGKK